MQLGGHILGAVLFVIGEHAEHLAPLGAHLGVNSATGDDVLTGVVIPLQCQRLIVNQIAPTQVKHHFIRAVRRAAQDQRGTDRADQSSAAADLIEHVIGLGLARVMDEQHRDTVAVGELSDRPNRVAVVGIGLLVLLNCSPKIGQHVDHDQGGVRVGIQPAI